MTERQSNVANIANLCLQSTVTRKNDWWWAVSMRNMDILNYIPVSYYPNLSIFDIARTKGATLSQQTLCTPLFN